MNTPIDNKKPRKEDQMSHARFLNTIAKVVFIISLAIFNVGFWVTAFSEHFRPAEFYITEH